jgi:hypothetical protein
VSPEEQNKANIRRGIEEIWNKGSWAASEQSYAPDMICPYVTHRHPAFWPELSSRTCLT